jgi:hypothetical protein
VVLIRRPSRDPHAEQRRRTTDQVRGAIDGIGEHGHAVARHRRANLQDEQDECDRQRNSGDVDAARRMIVPPGDGLRDLRAMASRAALAIASGVISKC